MAEGTGSRLGSRAIAIPFLALGFGLLLAIVVPVIALALASTPRELLAALAHPLVGPALRLSARTSALALVIVVLCGTPLAWIFARGRGPVVRVLQSLTLSPIVIPPAVLGLALLLAFGRKGLLGPWLLALGITIPFSTTAVVLAQVVVAAPFYVQAATLALRAVDDDLLLVARTLGASPVGAIVRVALPLAWPGLLDGAALCWARALGEFGATLLFAGNMPGRTQTMPLAIYGALEVDVHVAAAIALVLAMLAFATLLLVRAIAAGVARLRGP